MQSPVSILYTTGSIPVLTDYLGKLVITGSVASELIGTGSVLVTNFPVTQSVFVGNIVTVTGSFSAVTVNNSLAGTGSATPSTASLVGGNDPNGLFKSIAVTSTGYQFITGSVTASISGTTAITGSVTVNNLPTTQSVLISNTAVQVTSSGSLGITGSVAVNGLTFVSGSNLSVFISASNIIPVNVQNSVNITTTGSLLTTIGNTVSVTTTGSLGVTGSVTVTNLPTTQSVLISNTVVPVTATGSFGITGSVSINGLTFVSGSNLSVFLTSSNIIPVSMSNPVFVTTTGSLLATINNQVAVTSTGSLGITGSVTVNNLPPTQSVLISNNVLPITSTGSLGITGSVGINGLTFVSGSNLSVFLTASNIIPVSMSNPVFITTTGSLLTTINNQVSVTTTGSLGITGSVTINNLPATQSVLVANASLPITSTGSLGVTGSISVNGLTFVSGSNLSVFLTSSNIIPVSMSNPVFITSTGSLLTTIGNVVNISTTGSLGITGSVTVNNLPLTQSVLISNTVVPVTSTGSLGITGSVGVNGLTFVSGSNLSVFLTGSNIIPVNIQNSVSITATGSLGITGSVTVNNLPITQSVLITNSSLPITSTGSLGITGSVGINGLAFVSGSNLSVFITSSNIIPVSMSNPVFVTSTGSLLTTIVNTVNISSTGSLGITGSVTVNNLPTTQSVLVSNTSLSITSTGSLGVTGSVSVNGLTFVSGSNLSVFLTASNIVPVSMSNPVFITSTGSLLTTVGNTVNISTTGSLGITGSVTVNNLPTTQSVLVANISLPITSTGSLGITGSVSVNGLTFVSGSNLSVFLTSSNIIPVSMSNAVFVTSTGSLLTTVGNQVFITTTGSIPVVGSFANPSLAGTGSLVPYTGSLVGGSDGTNFRAFSVDSGGKLNVNATSVNASVAGTGSTAPASASLAGGVDGTGVLRGLLTDSSGRLQTSIYGTPTVNIGSGSAVVAMSVINAITASNYNLNAAAFVATSSISTDYILDHIEMNFSTTAARDIIITAFSGTIIWSGSANTARNIVLEDIGLAFNAGDNFVVSASKTNTACTLNLLATIRQGDSLGSTTITAGIKSVDGPSIDAFGRWRVSNPVTLFDSKQIFDNSPLFWDDQQVSGSGTTSTYVTASASTTLAVSANTLGWRMRQTYRRFNYQPGKSQNIILTGIIGTGSAGNIKRMGYYDDYNGLYFETSGSNFNVVRRTSATGVVVNNQVSQSAWNIDKLDGTGISGVNLDLSKANIYFTDFEWLGVGRVRMGVVVDGMIFYCHQFLNANNLNKVYMSTPNLPLRYSIINDGTGGANSIEQICATVISEGGSDRLGKTTGITTGTTAIVAASAGTQYAMLGIRLKSGFAGATVTPETSTLFCITNADYFQWSLVINPTVVGAFTYNNIANSACQYATGSATTTVTAGTGYVIATGIGGNQAASNIILPSATSLGVSINGTSDTLVLMVSPLGATVNLDMFAAMTFRELL